MTTVIALELVLLLLCIELWHQDDVWYRNNRLKGQRLEHDQESLDIQENS